MNVHGRLSPGLVEPGDRVTVRVHLPRKLAGVTLKLWDLDSFIGRDGPTKRDPSGDVLLAQWSGALAPGDGKTPNDLDYCTFTPSSSQISSDDADAFALQVMLPGASDAVAVPLGSERQELVARFLSLALSIEQGGSELFRTKSSCLARMPSTVLTFCEHTFAGRSDDRSFDPDAGKQEQTLAHHWVSFGVANGEGIEARLEVVGSGWIAANGIALDTDDDKGQPIRVRKGRKLYAYVHHRKLDLPKGKSKIPIASCAEVGDDGTAIVERSEQADQLEVRIAELPASSGDKPRFPIDLSKLKAEDSPDADAHLQAFAAAAGGFSKVT